MPQHVKCSFKTNNRILLSRYAGKANDCGKEKQKRFVVESSLYFVCNTVFEVNIIACNRMCCNGLCAIRIEYLVNVKIA